MEADGNCLFRSFADQVGGDCEEHQQYRDECCELMEDNAEEFELWHADEEDEESESFESYVRRMRHPGRWGSQLELMALCRRYSVNAIVHQSGVPSYEMEFAPREARCIQLSYHDGGHYNSIRFAWDVDSGKPVQHLSLAQLRGAAGDGDEGPDSEAVQEVRDCLPPEHEASSVAIRAALAHAGGDASRAAECLLAEKFGEGLPAGGDLDGSAGAEDDAAKNAAEAGSLSARRGNKAGAPKASKAKQTSEKRSRKAAVPDKLGDAKPAEDADEKLQALASRLLSV